MKVTLNSFNYVEDPDSFTPSQTLNWYKRSRDIKTIVIHWWNSPDKAGTFDQTVNYLKGANDTSIHFVVSDTRITQMVNLNNTAFHAMGANPISIGIEVDPRTPGKTLETTGALVRFIRELLKKDLPLSRHSDHVQTACPGTINLNQIEYWSRNESAPKPALVVPKPLPLLPVAKPTEVNYRVKDLSGKQIGAYRDEKNAWSKYIAWSKSAKIFDHNGTDVTQSFEIKFNPPKPAPAPVQPPLDTVAEIEKRMKAQEDKLQQHETSINTIGDFLSSIFKNFKK